ncbi:uncharacterized protein LOC123982405 isoform X2 [Micropterus dolomieu]|uniref:uncharacterized protein LOC123982405 isoform X2 n=1 Tax=Micropterus dolomieu TaxID=147949 RepID=UPI001E8CC8D9|nr:uncharacterized protein LOC123982405 isoform X2 [Micropterus dolomieu]
MLLPLLRMEEGTTWKRNPCSWAIIAWATRSDSAAGPTTVVFMVGRLAITLPRGGRRGGSRGGGSILASCSSVSSRPRTQLHAILTHKDRSCGLLKLKRRFWSSRDGSPLLPSSSSQTGHDSLWLKWMPQWEFVVWADYKNLEYIRAAKRLNSRQDSPRQSSLA